MSSAHTNGVSNSRGNYDQAWEEAARRIALTSIDGLRARCPSCHRAGTLISKWEPKIPVKPLFIVHANGNSHFKACSLAKGEAEAARRKVALSPNDVVKTFELGEPFVLFSGGMDSVCLLLYLSRLARAAGASLTALHADTTAGLPGTQEYVEEVCAILDVPLVTVRPLHDYFDLAKRWGLPGVRSRWCCETLKIAPLRRYLQTQDGPNVVYDGIRAAESAARAKYVPMWFHPSFRCISVSPILHWSDDGVAKQTASAKLPTSPGQALGTSAECWCGAYKSRADFEALLETYPDIFAKLVETEEAQRGKYTFLYENGQRVPLKSLMRHPPS